MALSIKEYLQRGPATSKEIQALTGLNQTAVARQLKSMGDRIITLRQGRSPRYAYACNAFGGDDKLPLAMLDVNGHAVLIAHIRPLAHGGFYVEQVLGLSQALSLLLLGEGGNGYYDDLPYFLVDLAPQGFLGRQMAAEMAGRSGDFPPDPRHWNANHIGRYLISNGDDLPGNFKFGPQALLRILHNPTAITRENYPELAQRVMNGVMPGSSAGGEQPKFTAFCSDTSSHVIVKFSPKGDSDIARRWRDILITEFYAAQAINQFAAEQQAIGELSCCAAETTLIELDGRLFLESRRFDRNGENGRLPMVSLQSVDAEFTGLGSDWLSTVNGLYKEKRISAQTVNDVGFLSCFGRLINNTDMHLGNLSLGVNLEAAPRTASVFKLLPVYDMCSMGFAPKGSGEVLAYRFSAKELRRCNVATEVFLQAEVVARDFWQSVKNDKRISDEFSAFLSLNDLPDLMREAVEY